MDGDGNQQIANSEESISEFKRKEQDRKTEAVLGLSASEIEAGNEMLRRFAASSQGKRLRPSGRRSYNYESNSFE